MRKAWEDMKPLRIWASQERLHHTKTMETNTNNWVNVTQPETNVLDLIQTTSNHAKHVCGLWGNWLGSVKRQGFPTKQELKPQRPWLKLDRADLIGKLGHKKIKKRTTVSLWFEQNAIRQYYLIVSMSSVLFKTWYMSCGHPSHIGNPNNLYMNPYYLLDGQTLFWENNPFFGHGTNDVKWAGQQCWNLCVEQQKKLVNGCSSL